MKKYKLTLLQDLPRFKAGTEVLNITPNELNGKLDYQYRYWVPEYNFSEIYDLRNNPDWVKVEIDNRCDCQTKSEIEIFRTIMGYGRSTSTTLNFEKHKIETWYDYECDSGRMYSLPIKYCPLCGKRLKQGGSNENL